MDWTRPLPLYSALAGRLDKRGEGGLPYCYEPPAGSWTTLISC